MMTTADPNDPLPPVTPRSNAGFYFVSGLLGLSLLGNLALSMRGPRIVERRVEVPAPAPPPAVATPT